MHVFVQTAVFLFHACAVEQVVLRLLHHRLMQVVALGNLIGRANVGRTPFAGAPVQGLALGDHVAHGPHGFFNRGVRVGAVAIDQVNEIELHALERSVNGL